MNFCKSCFVLLICFSFTSASRAQTNVPPATSNPDYGRIISTGNALLKAGDLAGAHADAMKALSLDGNRFEAYALESLVSFKKGNKSEAKTFMELALAKVPAAKKPQLEALAATIERGTDSGSPGDASAASAPVTAPGQPDEANQLHGDDRLEYETLLSTLSDADKATDLDQRHKILGDFMDNSGEFLEHHPNLIHLWIARAAVAVELDQFHDGWEAGQKLKALGLENSNDPAVEKVMVELNQKGWLNPTPETIVSWLNAHLDDYNTWIEFTHQASASKHPRKQPPSTSSQKLSRTISSFDLENGHLTIGEQDNGANNAGSFSMQVQLTTSVKIPFEEAGLEIAVTNIVAPDSSMSFGIGSDPTPKSSMAGVALRDAEITRTSQSSAEMNINGKIRHFSSEIATNTDTFVIFTKDMRSAQSTAGALKDLATIESSTH